MAIGVNVCVVSDSCCILSCYRPINDHFSNRLGIGSTQFDFERAKSPPNGLFQMLKNNYPGTRKLF